MSTKQTNSALSGYQTSAVAERMGEAAARFLATLAPDQRTMAVFPLDDEGELRNWHYTPIPRHGLPLALMERRQQRLAQQLVATGLSPSGYATAATIMGLESTLDMIEDWEREDPGRDPARYYVSIFAEPSASAPWGWRFEGHHISLHYTIAGGRIVAPTPTFFGSNPAETPLSGTAVLRPLAGVEDLARQLVHALDAEQRARAILAPVAPADIVLANRPRVEPGVLPELRADRQLDFTPEHAEALRYTAEPRGLGARAMSAGQRELLQALLHEYIGRMPDEIAELERARLGGALDEVHFVWAGGIERRQGHYYRLQGTRFLVEYDNTQNDNNHIHSVWRDPSNDFGADLLAQHYRQAHDHN
ncbi:MAG TPA: DUF3500 domain-containing protein [Thermomicrobiaceae bacterium]|nr:DUF3500 domain-containing protein [Thermomicrobiaceae bacterium]